MQKSELIKAVAEKSGTDSKTVGKIISQIISTIQSELIAGNEVSILGFGTFKVTERDKREGRNPRTGDKMIIPAHKLPVFKAGEILKKAVN